MTLLFDCVIIHMIITALKFTKEQATACRVAAANDLANSVY